MMMMDDDDDDDHDTDDDGDNDDDEDDDDDDDDDDDVDDDDDDDDDDDENDDIVTLSSSMFLPGPARMLPTHPIPGSSPSPYPLISFMIWSTPLHPCCSEGSEASMRRNERIRRLPTPRSRMTTSLPDDRSIFFCMAVATK